VAGVVPRGRLAYLQGFVLWRGPCYRAPWTPDPFATKVYALSGDDIVDADQATEEV
jgi:hypothetical protein